MELELLVSRLHSFHVSERTVFISWRSSAERLSILVCKSDDSVETVSSILAKTDPSEALIASIMEATAKVSVGGPTTGESRALGLAWAFVYLT